MGNEFRIKPSLPELIVRDPFTRKPLEVDGETKPRSKYWLSRKLEGSVIEVQEETKPATSAAAAKAEKKSAAQAAGGDN